MERVNVTLTFVILITSIPSRLAIRNINSLHRIHVISRHGDRTPVDTYPTDPHVNASFEPFGWGQLTGAGRNNQYELGRFLKARYKKFFGKECCTQEMLKIQSTDCARTKMSAQLQAAGLLADSSLLMSIPVVHEPLNEDKLLLVRIPCPRYFELRHSAVEFMKTRYASILPKRLYDYLTKNTGMKIETPDDVQSLYSTLKAEEDFHLELPNWTHTVYPTTMYKVAVISFVINAYNREMQKLKAGQFLSQLVNHYLRIINSKKEYDEKKAFLYVGHDSTIANLLIALDIWQEHIPPYNSMIVFELQRKLESDDFTVQVLYKNSTAIGAEMYQLKLPHCEQLCPLRKFIDLTEDVRSTNLELECVSNKWTSIALETSGP